ncbi:Cholecystokinin receptor [Holothuria leucospilota]|uniref:Cholecystokinin receptor n=1 Tax=Holothuria leucospilota TaxID=206669 RepID=A0A9Q1C8F7_HOLLE|nr:Cholecystokinin receptor [Holothuria leucospilota]
MASVEDCPTFNETYSYYSYSLSNESFHFDPGQKAVRGVVITFLSMVTLFGTIGNTLVLMSLTIGTRKLGITSILLGSLSFSDFCINVWLVPIEIKHLLSPYWRFGSVLCVFTAFLSSFAQSSSACMLLAISWERFLVILYPLTSRTMLTRRRTFILVLVTWTISAGLAAFPASFKEVLPHDPCDEDSEEVCTSSFAYHNDHRMQLFMYIYALLIVYLIPLGGMAVANTCVIRALIKSSKYTKKLQSVKSLEKGVRYSVSSKNGESVAICNNNDTHPSGDEKSAVDSMVASGSGDDPFPPVTKAKEKPRAKKKSHSSVAQRKKVVMMLVAVIILYAICWLPYMIFGALYIVFKVPHNYFGMIVLESFSRICYSCNSALNPIVYGFMSKNFRQRIIHGFRRCIQCRFRRSDRANSFSSAYTLSTRGPAISQSTRQTKYSAVPRA